MTHFGRHERRRRCRLRRHAAERDREAGFGALLRRYRVAAGLTQESLADRARLSARAISSYERGIRRAPYPDSLRRLVEALRLSAEERTTFEAAARGRRSPKNVSRSAVATVHRTNMVKHNASFVGRQRELAEARFVLENGRLLTLCGPAGCGKTRLALEVVRDVQAAYPDGTWVVDFASLANESLAVDAVARAIGVRDEPGQRLLDTVCASLRRRRTLLVLDHCEHVRGVCAQFAEAVLRECPEVRIVVTSQEALGLVAEETRQVPNLMVPHADEATVSSIEAVQLFVERARAMKPSFSLSRQNAAAVALVCRKLNGMPLAIELAAARVRVLGVEQVARELTDHLQHFNGSSHVAPSRQSILRATLEWMYAQLTDPQRALFRRVAILCGSFDLGAVEGVGASTAPGEMSWGWTALHAGQNPGLDSVSVLALLTELVDDALIQEEGPAGQPRYRLPEPVRQFGLEKLAASGETETARRRHRKWYLTVVDRAEPELLGPRQGACLDRLEHDYCNLRAIAANATSDRGGLLDSVRLVAKLLRLWLARGCPGEGRRLLEPILERCAADPDLRRTPAWLEAQHASSMGAYFQDDYDAVRTRAESCIALAHELGDARLVCLVNDMLTRALMSRGETTRARAIFADQLVAMRGVGHAVGVASALVGLCTAARLDSDYRRSISYGERGLAEIRGIGDVWLVGQAQTNLGLSHYQLGEYGIARKQFAEAAAHRREVGDQSGVAWSLINLGDVALAQGSYNDARVQFTQSLAVHRELGDRPGQAVVLAALGRVARAQGDLELSRLRLLESLMLRRDLGQRHAMPQMIEDVAGLLAALGDQHVETLAGASAQLRDRLKGCPDGELERIEGWSGPIHRAPPDLATDHSADKTITLSQAIGYCLAAGDPWAPAG